MLAENDVLMSQGVFDCSLPMEDVNNHDLLDQNKNRSSDLTLVIKNVTNILFSNPYFPVEGCMDSM